MASLAKSRQCRAVAHMHDIYIPSAAHLDPWAAYRKPVHPQCAVCAWHHRSCNTWYESQLLGADLSHHQAGQGPEIGYAPLRRRANCIDPRFHNAAQVKTSIIQVSTQTDNSPASRWAPRRRPALELMPLNLLVGRALLSINDGPCRGAPKYIMKGHLIRTSVPS